VDAEGKIVSANPAAATVLGYESPKDLIGRHILELYAYPEQREAALKKIAEIGYLEDFEVVAKRKDGTNAYLLMSATMDKDGQGNLLRSNGIFRDITERKKIEKALRERTTLLNEAERIAHLGSWSLDLKTNKFSASDEMIDIYQYPEDKALDVENWLPFVYPEDRDRVMAALQDAMSGLRPYNIEFRIMRADGEVRTLWAQGEVVQYESGKPVKMMGTGMDITERKKADRALRKSQARLEAAQALGHIGNWELNFETKTGFWSKELFRLYGFDPARGVPALPEFTKMVHPDDRALLQETYERVKKEGKTLNVVFRMNTGLEDERYFDTTIAAIKNAEGDLLHMAGTVQDITERKKAEEQLQEYQSKLKAMASQLSSIQERQRRQLAVEMHDRVTQKLAMAKLGLETAAASFVDDEAAEKIKNIARQVGQTMEDAYSLMLELSNPVLYEIGLKAALDTLLQSDFVKHCGIKCKLVTPGQPLNIETDIRVALYQSARELLVNAIKYSKAKQIEIRLDRTQEAVVVAVKDDGIGFDPSTVKPPGKRGGFGLFNIRESIGGLGGEFTIKTKSGEGTSASVCIPLPLNVSPV
jgi:PAS domain S-box-containing protein